VPGFFAFSCSPQAPGINLPASFNEWTVDPATGTLAVVRDAAAVGQHVRQRVMAWKKEWFLNPDAGIDWTRYVLGRPPSEREIAEATIKREILATPGVVSILQFESEYDRRSRGLRLTKIVLQTIFDDTVDVEF
jgi:hypothetical protein